MPPSDLKLSVLSMNSITELSNIIFQSEDEKSLLRSLKSYSKRNGIKFPALMKDLRLLLTGKSDGPPVTELVDLLGRESIVRRMKKYEDSIYMLIFIDLVPCGLLKLIFVAK